MPGSLLPGSIVGAEFSRKRMGGRPAVRPRRTLQAPARSRFLVNQPLQNGRAGWVGPGQGTPERAAVGAGATGRLTASPRRNGGRRAGVLSNSLSMGGEHRLGQLVCATGRERCLWVCAPGRQGAACSALVRCFWPVVAARSAERLIRWFPSGIGAEAPMKHVAHVALVLGLLAMAVGCATDSRSAYLQHARPRDEPEYYYVSIHAPTGDMGFSPHGWSLHETWRGFSLRLPEKPPVTTRLECRVLSPFETIGAESRPVEVTGGFVEIDQAEHWLVLSLETPEGPWWANGRYPLGALNERW